ncbi:MAG: proton-conducting transporter membrane subunit, partial [Candidatus Micrarchaeota archaeon]|nr:proton-conducting transporter membrane subunit [Candidatus Micrarchaeota archaeon]
MLELIILPPILAGILAFAFQRNARMVEASALAGAVLSALFALMAVSGFLQTPVGFRDFYDLLYLDAISGLFTALTAVVACLIFLYSIGYIRHEVKENVVEKQQVWLYYGLFSLFLAAMLTATLAAHPVVMWAAIEATTLASVFLISFYQTSSSFEAAWKFFIINSVGILLALAGILFLLFALLPQGATSGGNWDSLMVFQPGANLLFLKIAFAFILVGFGTKVGLVPLHVWLPDAHSQAPTPVSAILSGLLLNIAFYGIVRTYQVVAPYDSMIAFASGLLIAFGLLSLAIGALRIYFQHNIKRMLAYSSIENMGIVVLALGLGGPLGVGAALFHMVSHSLAKPLAFFASGIVAFAYKTKEMPLISGAAQVVPLVAIPFIFIAAGLAGSPPFGTFLSELGVLAVSLSSGQWWITLIFVVCTTIAFASLLYRISAISLGAKPEGVAPFTPSLTMMLSFVVLLAFTLCMGLMPPSQFIELLVLAVRAVI